MRPTVPRLLLCLSLLLACGLAGAAESRHMDPGGGGACPDTATTGDERIDEGDEAAPAPARRTTPKSKPAATATPRTSGGGRSTPRWHSFLPGMIR